MPPYHDQHITKPVNVQMFIEHNRRKCDPHSFTYDPIPIPAAAAVAHTATTLDPTSTATVTAAAIRVPYVPNGDNCKSIYLLSRYVFIFANMQLLVFLVTILVVNTLDAYTIESGGPCY